MTTAAEWVVRVSIWLALVGYVAGALHACGQRHDTRWSRLARILWTLGCVALVVHAISAFQFYYEWSHRVALSETARQTAKLTGRDTGAGLYLNYLFVLLWALDAAWWWRGFETYRRRRPAVVVALHGFMFFMVFNGTVVFANGAVRWLGVAITIMLGGALLLFRSWRDNSP